MLFKKKKLSLFITLCLWSNVGFAMQCKAPISQERLATFLPKELRGRYEAVELLGEGNTGIVLKVQDTRGMLYALKVITKRGMTQYCEAKKDREAQHKPELDKYPEATMNFEREVGLAKGYMHTWCVKTYESSLPQAPVKWMLMEYLDGLDLFEIVQAKSINNDNNLKRVILAQAALAVHYLHRHGIAHRDIKTENFVLTKNGLLFLIDFNFAVHGASKDTKITDPSEQKNYCCGSPDYIAPEIIRACYFTNCELSPIYPCAVDMWALGVTFNLIAAREYPFSDYNNNKKYQDNAYNLRHHQLSSLREAQPVIDALLEKDPSKRMTAEQLLQQPFIRDCLCCFVDHVVSLANVSEEEKVFILGQVGIELGMDPEALLLEMVNKADDAIKAGAGLIKIHLKK